MKYFFKGLRIGLGIGIPIIAVLLIFLQVNNYEIIPEFPVSFDSQEEPWKSEEPTIEPDTRLSEESDKKNTSASNITLVFALSLIHI